MNNRQLPWTALHQEGALVLCSERDTGRMAKMSRLCQTTIDGG